MRWVLGLSVGDWGAVVQIAAGAAALAALLVSSFALRHVISFQWLRALTRAVGGEQVLEVVRHLEDGIDARLDGRPWRVREELEALARSGARWRDEPGPLPWARARLGLLAEGYEAAVPRLRRSFLLRLRSADAIARETDIAQRTAAVLRLDADFADRLERPRLEGRGPLAQLLARHGSHVLVGPEHAGRAGAYDGVRVTILPERFGAPPLGMAELARAQPPRPGAWRGVDRDRRPALDARVRTAAAASVAAGQDFNGEVARLLDWRVEVSATSLARRLHLLVQPTTYATALATNVRLDRAHGDDLDALVRAGCLDRHLGAPARCTSANHLAVHLVVVSRDRKLVLAHRAAGTALSAGTYSTAANGVVEMSRAGSVRRGDHDAEGFLDLAATAVREAHEEVGEHLRLGREALVARALLLNATPEQVVPFVVFETRSPLSFEEIASGHFAHADRREGAFEVGESFVGLPLTAAHAPAVVGWLRRRWGDGPGGHGISSSGLASSLLTVAQVLDERALAAAWAAPDDAAVEALPVAVAAA